MPSLLATLAGRGLMEGVPPNPLLLLSRRESRCIKAGRNGGEKIRRGEGLIPLCGRKYC